MIEEKDAKNTLIPTLLCFTQLKDRKYVQYTTVM